MKYYVFSAALLVGAILMPPVAFLQDPPSEPTEYPAGSYCTPSGIRVNGLQTPDHPCHCHRMSYAEDCETNIAEDQTCNQYCHLDHCACPVSCEVKPNDPGR